MPRINSFHIAVVVCAAVAVWGIIAPESLAGSAAWVTGTAFRAVGWFFMTAVTGLLVVALWLAFSRYGRVRLSRKDERPEFSTVSWLAMLFAAGMGAGLLFWGVAEPISHFAAPPVGDAETAEAARRAMVITNFHWGLHAWGVYCMAGLVLAYFAFRRRMPYLPGSPLRSALKGRWVEPAAKTVDFVAVLAVAFSVAGSMGLGIFQLQSGLGVVLDVDPESVTVATGILIVLAACYISSAATGLDKGIKWLSNVNIGLAVALLLFVLLFGPTAFLLRNLVTSVGDYASSVVGMSLSLYPYQEADGWLDGWTLTFMTWWIAWTPFVGVFIARISRGRTIRQFVLGVLLAPTGFSVVWFAVFGGTAMYEEMKGDGGISELVREDVTLALFDLFERLPLSAVLSGVAILLVFIFLVTSVDSSTYVLGMLTSRGSTDPPATRRITWGIILAGMGGALMLGGTYAVVRAVAVLGALPFTLIVLLQTAALLKALAADRRAAKR